MRQFPEGVIRRKGGNRIGHKIILVSRVEVEKFSESDRGDHVRFVDL
jgi:hypothetical protein